MLALPLSPVMMLIVVLFLIFLLGWPFEWPAIILVFLPIFYPVMDALKPQLATSLGIAPDMVMVWFGALVAVTLADRVPVAAGGDVGLLPAAGGEGMVARHHLQGHVRVHGAAVHRHRADRRRSRRSPPAFPEQLQHEARQVKTEEVDDSMNRLEEDPLQGGARGTGGGGEPRKRRMRRRRRNRVAPQSRRRAMSRRYFLSHALRFRHPGRPRRHLEHALGAASRRRRHPAVGGRHRTSARRPRCCEALAERIEHGVLGYTTPPRRAARGDRRAPASGSTAGASIPRGSCSCPAWCRACTSPRA